MLVINHVASALLIKKKFPGVNMFLILISVQLVELLWIIFCYTGIEYVTTSAEVKYLGDIQRAYMPFSHSLLSSLILAFTAYVVIKNLFKNTIAAVAVSLAILSHIVLDVFMIEIPLIFSDQFKVGTNLWTTSPYLAFYIELTFGFLCWWYYGGTRKLLAVIISFNLICFTLFSPDIIGYEHHLANKPELIITLVLCVIIITTILVGILSKKTLSVTTIPEVSPLNL
jgi:hypothetical protein